MRKKHYGEGLNMELRREIGASNSIPGSYGMSLWKTISSGWSTFSCYIQFQIGDGTRVKFWQDIRCGSFDRVGWKFADLRARVD